MEKKRIIILGGGFGGVYTASELLRRSKRFHKANLDVEVILVSEENYITFQPLLPEVVSGAVEQLHVISPIRRTAPGVVLYTRQIEKIDVDNMTVQLSPGRVPRSEVLKYDHLVIALGNQLAHNMVPGMYEHAIPFKYLGDALRLRNHIVQMLEEASVCEDAEERERLLTFVVAGGGFSGVECIAEMDDFLKKAVRSFPRITRNDLRMVLVQSADRILPEMKESLATYADKLLRRRGINIVLEHRLHEVSADRAIILCKENNEQVTIPTRTVVATVPTEPHQVILDTPLERERGRILVSDEMESTSHPGVWSLGDCAAVPSGEGYFSPPTAQYAVRQAVICAENILATLQAKPRKRFKFAGLGKLASLGARCAVAEVLGFTFSGFIAWVMWRAIYVGKMPGLDRKIRVFLDWLKDFFLPRDITQLNVHDEQQVRREHLAAGQTLFHQGDFGDRLYFVAKGKLEIEVDGRVVNTTGEGDVIGEMALLSHKARSATVRAVESTDLVSLPRDAFDSIIQYVPGAAEAMAEIHRKRMQQNADEEASVDDAVQR
ncbi:NADH dehydrogenase-like protein [Bremerella volcania]|uniref:NADH dehydrogenase-like protein n=1 Tax=Bremerella volcania TaxID=2527984 RepID=A0A518CFH1_9BACT|nr:FAD-dependent oxidoreductase [Bremerella volcania]QDU77983.1 NADH dehydrogenase-like protein [Bremerella volcania]